MLFRDLKNILKLYYCDNVIDNFQKDLSLTVFCL